MMVPNLAQSFRHRIKSRGYKEISNEFINEIKSSQQYLVATIKMPIKSGLRYSRSLGDSRDGGCLHAILRD